ncbi:glucose 1-dehydrogenase [Kocuria sediminis]|uniref:Glucose 1-dehydrogenase n=1 Tax=Kocuria sediminis TaxID=1038857 RepID=A0A6N8GLC3_9MICC|nr:glucose 1-dehydrogenase [Kocuria sediminis]
MSETAGSRCRRFEDRVAVVTGASRGIGLGIAERLVAEGARVCLTARKPEALEAAVECLGGPERAIAVPGQGSDPDHHAEVVERTLEAFGRLDHLVNNTGINPVYGTLDELDHAAARKIVEVNVLGTLSMTRAAARTGLGAHGSVVNVASVAGTRPAPGIGFYGATKAAVLHLTEELALELAPRVRVNAVAPAIVRTRFAAALLAEGEEQVAAGYPLGRIGTPADVAAATAFLLSEDASWITGRTLVLDGGSGLNGPL